MIKKSEKTNPPIHRAESDERTNLEGYPVYPSSEDIYSKYRKASVIDPEDISKNKGSNENVHVDRRNDEPDTNHPSGSDLDIPGSELDDDQEKTGNEDEENNYYSLGGDDHNDLDEENG